MRRVEHDERLEAEVISNCRRWLNDFKTCKRCGVTYPADTKHFDPCGGGRYLRHVCRACRKMEKQADHIAHREKRNAASKERYCAETSEQRATRLAYREAHREDQKRWAADWYARNRERQKEKARDYASGHREEATKRAIQWAKEHPEERRANAENRRARKVSAGGTYTAQHTKDQIKRQRGRCFWCHAELVRYHVDHVVPLALGGSNGPENLVITCPRCNLSKRDSHPMDFAGVML